jgi:Holliday junction resolvase
MANKHYERGRRFEWLVKKDMEDQGWLSFRTAGSHGLFDIICICEEDHGACVRLIQCKTTDNEKTEKSLLKEFINTLHFDQGSDIQQLLAVKVTGKSSYKLYTAFGENLNE